jgi:hypothetical protein
MKHIVVTDDIDHVYFFIKSSVMVFEKLEALTIYLKGISVAVLYCYRSMQ